jgi:hypothetical protein
LCPVMANFALNLILRLYIPCDAGGFIGHTVSSSIR